MRPPHLFLHRRFSPVARRFSSKNSTTTVSRAGLPGSDEMAVFMRDRQVKNVSVVLGSTLIALIAGGCGGGDSAPAAPPGPLPTGTINTGSALTVAGRAVDAALQSGSFGNITDYVGLTTVATNDPGNLGSGRLMKIAGWNVTSKVPVGPENTPCEVDGSLTVSGDIANPLTVTAGDFLDFVWANCDDGLGQVINGTIGMTFTEFEGDLLAGQILLGVSLDVGNFRVTEGEDFNMADGDLALTIDSRAQPSTVVTTFGSSFVVSNPNSTETLTGFSSMVTENTSVFPSNFTKDTSGTVSSTQFDGSVNYDTPVTFQSIGDGYPYAGEMRVSGESNATIRIIVLNEASVRIEADYDGDGASDATITTTWEALING